MLKICLVFWISEPQYAYKRYAYKKKHVAYISISVVLQFQFCSYWWNKFFIPISRCCSYPRWLPLFDWILPDYLVYGAKIYFSEFSFNIISLREGQCSFLCFFVCDFIRFYTTMASAPCYLIYYPAYKISKFDLYSRGR